MRRDNIPVPLSLGQYGNGVRGVLEEVVVLGLLASDDLLSFLADLNHGVTEPDFICQICPAIGNRTTYRSISSSDSDSVGSISIHVEMGQEQVGGWKP